MTLTYAFYFFHSSTTAPSVTITTTTTPTQSPTDQYIALQSLASETVEAAQTGRMASSLNLDISSIEVTDPEPPRELPKGWERATPADGKHLRDTKRRSVTIARMQMQNILGGDLSLFQRNYTAILLLYIIVITKITIFHNKLNKIRTLEVLSNSPSVHTSHCRVNVKSKQK